MRSKSPELMSEIKKYIEDYYLQNRQSPSTTKIAEAVGIARGTAYKYLVEMAEKRTISGIFEKYDAQIVTIEGIKYISFNTNHFSNYIIASNNVVNPNTLDNIGLYFGIMALTLGVIVILVIKSNKKLKR